MKLENYLVLLCMFPAFSTAQVESQSGCAKLRNAYASICPGQFQNVAAVAEQGPPGKRGPQGQYGETGPRGLPGSRGPPGNVDYSRVEAIETRIENLTRTLEKVMEANALLEKKINEINETIPIIDGEECYMGMKSRAIPDSAITASSILDNRHAAYFGRLDNQEADSSKLGRWVPRTNGVGEWIQVDFQTIKKVKGVISQGAPHADQWVTSYKVSCGSTEDGLSTIQVSGTDKIFTGNSDRSTKVYNEFPKIMSCRYIRIYPQTYEWYMSMRIELASGNCRDVGI